MIRTELPALRTEPSSTCATCSVRAISGIAISLPLNENDEVRAVTCNCGIFASRFSSSSEIPSEKYSCSLSLAHVDERQHGDAFFGEWQ